MVPAEWQFVVFDFISYEIDSQIVKAPRGQVDFFCGMIVCYEQGCPGKLPYQEGVQEEGRFMK
jgi:hypothetical protein